jgi:hypothetical protein
MRLLGSFHNGLLAPLVRSRHDHAIMPLYLSIEMTLKVGIAVNHALWQHQPKTPALKNS